MGRDHDQLEAQLASATTDAQVLAAAAIAAAEPAELDTTEVYSLTTPEGATSEVLDLERFLDTPRRARGSVVLQTVDDLVLYAKRHDDTDATTLWVNADACVVTAVLNDHVGSSGTPGWGDHRAVLALKPTPEWLHWTGKDGQLISQEAFAEHVEDGLLEITSPDGAEMLEVAQSIQGTKSAEFSNARRLTDGNIGVSYVEETTATAGTRGELEIPARFTLLLAPFLGEQPVELHARLRWRLRGGDLVLGYKLEHPERVVRDVIDAIGDRLNQQFAGDRVFIGSPRT